jgi:hypothetical protein
MTSTHPPLPALLKERNATVELRTAGDRFALRISWWAKSNNGLVRTTKNSTEVTVPFWPSDDFLRQYVEACTGRAGSATKELR